MNSMVNVVKKFDTYIHTKFVNSPHNIGRIYALLSALCLFLFEFFAKFTKVNIPNILFIRGLVDTYFCLYLSKPYISLNFSKTGQSGITLSKIKNNISLDPDNQYSRSTHKHICFHCN